MATLNGAAYLRRQLESILPQLLPEDELIVSDDGSDDGTMQIMRGLKDARIRLVSGPRRGLSANFAFALAQARNDAIFLCDQDDVWQPDKVAHQSRLLGRYLLIVSDCTVTNQQGEVIHDSYFRLNRSGPGLLRNLVRNSFLGCCMAFRRELLSMASPFPDNVPHDWWLGMVALIGGNVLFLPQQLVRYRRHDATASFAAGTSGRKLSARLTDRVRLAGALAARSIRHGFRSS
jgi:glycosyltransferase involved in cell wall biosynthesis